MAPRRIAIIGGGMAGLTAAYELTRTEALARRHRVTVYQLGWRLGGKGASSRDPDNRILEHGLHIWYGFYENAFQIIQDVYRHWKRAPDNPLRTWRDAFEGHSFTPFGDEVHGDYLYHPVVWPKRRGVPGDGSDGPSPWESLIELTRLARSVVATWSRTHPLPGSPVAGLPARLVRAYRALRLARDPAPDADGNFGRPDSLLGAALAWALRAPSAGIPASDLLRGLMVFWRSVRSRLRAARAAYNDPETRYLDQLFDVATAFACGIIQDFFLDRRSIDEVDALDFREWLIRHGGDPDTVRRSDVVKSLYDTMFEYEEGDTGRPNYAAGTAAQVLLRIVTTYKEAVFYLMRAGMGETVMAPLYEVLKDRGVRFRFFRRFTRFELSSDARSIARVRMDVQAETAGDYDPLITRNGLRCWPDQPLWDQIRGGAALRDAGTDFESSWSPWRGVGEEVLVRDRDFDDVILAIPLGAFTPLSAGPAPCDELAAANPAFGRMMRHAVLVPTQSAQVWFDVGRERLGWRSRAATVSGPPPFGIWADMSPVLATERPPPGRPHARALAYACGVFATDLYRRPRSDASVPARALESVERNVDDWLERRTARVWPGARDHGAFNWEMLHDPRGRRGRARRRSQYVRANVNPTDCCVASTKGSTASRLKADESGFGNLFLAGAWIATGFNSECIEGAAMSGRQAARAISGHPARIPGEDFLRGDLHRTDWRLPSPRMVMASVMRAAGSLLSRIG